MLDHNVPYQQLLELAVSLIFWETRWSSYWLYVSIYISSHKIYQYIPNSFHHSYTPLPLSISIMRLHHLSYHIISFIPLSSIYTIPGWWFQTPWKILVSWDYYSQYMGKLKMFQTTSQIHYNDIPQSIPIVIFSLPAPSLASKMRSPRTSRCQTAMFGALVRDFFQFLSWEYIWYINHYIYYIL